MTPLTDLQDRTAFEQFALQSAAALQPSDRRVRGRFDRRSGEGSQFIYAEGINAGDESVKQLKRDLRPLMFGAAWKIVDLAIEYSIGWTGGHIQISEKVRRANNTTAPAPFDQLPEVWQAIVETYNSTQELRNGLTHGRAEVDVGGPVRNVNKHTLLTEELDPAGQLAFCRLSQRVLNCIASGLASERDVFDMTRQLLALSQYSKFAGATAGRDPQQVYELIDAVPISSGRGSVDVPALIRCAKEKFSDPVYIDFIGYLDDGRANVLTGALETAGMQLYEFSLDSPPSWLTWEVRLTS